MAESKKLSECLSDCFASKTEECKSCACTVKEFFEAIDNPNSAFKVRIPAYQRPYAWGVREVNQLIQDLETKATTESPYHLGTIILHYDKDEATFNVVDGQQRLRTFEMLLEKVGAIEDLRKFTSTSQADGDLSDDEKEKKQKAETERQRVEVRCAQKRDDEKFIGNLLNGTLVFLIVQNIDEAFQLFETQNGRGKPLSVENLLKAYHYHEMTHGHPSQRPTKERLYELEDQWEHEVVNKQEDELHGGHTSVLSKYLLLARHWSRGAGKPKIGRHLGETRVPHLDEYKGLTLNPESAPLQNPWVVCRIARLLLSDGSGHILVPKAGLLQCPGDLLHMAGSLLLQTYLASRGGQEFKGNPNRALDPFATICQPIINGDAFFEYAVTFERMTKDLFKVEDPLSSLDKDFRAFQAFYRVVKNKKSDISKHARVVYETFLLLTFDRFGLEGVKSLYLDLWLLAYYERVTKYSLRYDSAGKKYGNAVCILLANAASLSKVASEINKLKQDAVEDILKSDETIKGHFRERWKNIAPKREELVKETQKADPTFMDSDLKNSIEDKFPELEELAKEALSKDENKSN